MKIKFAAAAVAGACLIVAMAKHADAHVIAGDRLFPVTLTFDDPGVADEVTLPQFVYQPGESGQKSVSIPVGMGQDDHAHDGADLQPGLGRADRPGREDVSGSRKRRGHRQVAIDNHPAE